MSEDKVRAEFEAAWAVHNPCVDASRWLRKIKVMGRGEEYAEWSVKQDFEWFKKGRQSIAKDVPVEALAEVLRISDRAHPAWEECKAFLRTIEEMKQ